MAFQKEELYNQLRQGVYEIEFQKTDGSIRTIQASLQKGVVPDSVEKIAGEQMHLDTDGNQRNILRVWSLKDLGWRSVRITHINRVSAVNA